MYHISQTLIKITTYVIAPHRTYNWSVSPASILNKPWNNKKVVISTGFSKYQLPSIEMEESAIVPVFTMVISYCSWLVLTNPMFLHENLTFVFSATSLSLSVRLTELWAHSSALPQCLLRWVVVICLLYLVESLRILFLIKYTPDETGDWSFRPDFFAVYSEASLAGIIKHSCSLSPPPDFLLDLVKCLVAGWSSHRGAFCLLLAGSLWHKDSWLPCTERSY